MKKRAAVIGLPITHSLSPDIFAFLSDRLGVKDLTYSPLAIEPLALGEFMKAVLESDEWVGFNVTTPHKQAIIPFLDELSDEARAVGAVNTVSLKAGRSIGSNTDIEGIEASLAQHKSLLKNALIIGAGGAAHAAAYVLGKNAADTVFLQNKTLARAQDLAEHFQEIFPRTKFVAVEELEDVQRKLSLFINCTPVGMQGFNADPVLLKRVKKKMTDILSLKHGAGSLAFDLIYRPERTEFLKVADGLGFETMGGLEMLMEQALATWRIWLGRERERDILALKNDLRTHLRSLLAKAETRGRE